MKILIIGSNGFIGKYYKNFSKLKNLLTTSSKKNSSNIYFNIMSHDLQKIIDEYNITHVVFFSAISDPLKCERNKRLSRKFNVTLTKRNLNKLIKNNIYFIFFSSEYVFNGIRGGYSENSKTGNKLLYGKQKVIMENYLKKKNYRNFSILRLGKTFGDNINDKSIFMNFLKNYLNKKRNFAFAKDQIFSCLYVKDLVKIIDIFIKKKISGIFNVCGNDHYSRADYLIKISKKFNLKNCVIKKKNFDQLSNLKDIPLNVSMKNDKLKKLIKFKFTDYKKYLEIINRKYGNKF